LVDWSAYGGLFLSAFLAATVLPAASEAVLVGLLVADQQPVAGLLLAASSGNVLGAVVNWGLGRWIAHWQHKSWFPVNGVKLGRALGLVPAPRQMESAPELGTGDR
jgi:membrane protein YqaA with SNARE-associated domain